MKKVLFVLMFLFSGLSRAETINYSLEEMFTKIVQSESLSPMGKVFLMGYFEDLDPIELDLNDLSKQLCEEASFEGVKLFNLNEDNCQSNLVLFLAHLEKAFEATVNINIGGDGKITGGNITLSFGSK